MSDLLQAIFYEANYQDYLEHLSWGHLDNVMTRRDFIECNR